MWGRYYAHALNGLPAIDTHVTRIDTDHARPWHVHNVVYCTVGARASVLRSRKGDQKGYRIYTASAIDRRAHL